MKLWIPLHMTFLCMALLSAMGAFTEKQPKGHDTNISECWEKPNAYECTNKCSRSLKCYNANLTCCWTYCGNVCWKPVRSFPHG